jgi:SAM-dependent methyltransferase
MGLSVALDPVGSEWLRRAEARYLADLTFAEATRALRALSSCYVERRSRLTTGAALGTAGKRAAFALYYGPLHYLTVLGIARALAEGSPPLPILDIGCGTGAAGAAWARAAGGRVDGTDVNPWAVAEARWTYGALDVPGTARRVPVDGLRWPSRPSVLVAAFVLNELSPATRDLVRPRLLEAASRGHRVVIAEPVARGVAPWWPDWERAVVAAGGRRDEWRLDVELPDLIRRFDRASGLDHRKLTARTLTLGFP